MCPKIEIVVNKHVSLCSDHQEKEEGADPHGAPGWTRDHVGARRGRRQLRRRDLRGTERTERAQRLQRGRSNRPEERQRRPAGREEGPRQRAQRLQREESVPTLGPPLCVLQPPPTPSQGHPHQVPQKWRWTWPLRTCRPVLPGHLVFRIKTLLLPSSFTSLKAFSHQEWQL